MTTATQATPLTEKARLEAKQKEIAARLKEIASHEKNARDKALDLVAYHLGHLVIKNPDDLKKYLPLLPAKIQAKAAEHGLVIVPTQATTRPVMGPGVLTRMV